MRLAMKGDKEFCTKGSLYASQKGFTVQVQAAAVLSMSSNEKAWVDSYTHVRAAPAGTNFPEWYKTTDPFLNGMVGSSYMTFSSNIKESDLHGFQVTFLCGTRLQMHDIDPADHSALADLKPFGQCVREGAAENTRMKKAAPWTRFLPQEVVVRAVFEDLTTCYHEADTRDKGKPYWKPTEQPLKEGEEAKRNFYEAENPLYKAFSNAGPKCRAVHGPTLPKYLKDMRAGKNYRGLLVASGSPPDTLQEVLLDPEELMSELSNMKK